MWIFNNDSFVSIVQDLDDPKYVYVRGRRLYDVMNFTGKREEDITETPNNDYSFRVKIKKTELAEILMNKAMYINYGNFKNSIPLEDSDYIKMCHEVWGSGVRNLDERYVLKPKN